jgi:hypothetical protein
VVLPALSVSTSTQGVELDPDGYNLVIDGSQTQPVGLSATLVVDRLPDGDHSLELAGLASNCSTQSENPRTVTVRAGATTTAAFQVTCTATSGSVEVSTSTAGTGSDPDGFVVLLDGTERGAVAVGAAAMVSGVPAGSHSIGLTGLAGNCQVAGENPRTITVSPSQTTQVPFSVSCTVPGPTAGTLEISTATTGSNPDPDGYSVALDGGATQPIGSTSSLTLTNVGSGARRVELLGIAPNCSVSGSNPRNATVAAGQTTRVTFTISCAALPPETGSVRVTTATSGGSLDPDGYTVTVDGGGSQTLAVNGTRTIPNLAVGSHSMELSGLASNCSVAGDNPRNATVAAGQTVTISFEVNCVAASPTINLRVERMYLTQSTQRLGGDVPLVQGRDGMVRVFVTASGANTARPSVRVRLYRNGAEVRSFTVAAGGNSTPTSVQQDGLASSWNVAVPGDLITTGLSILADVDPANAIPETSETDNSFPGSGNPQTLSVQSVSAAAITFVPIRQSANGLQGTVGNPDQLLDLAKRMYPLNTVTAAVHPVFTVSGPLDPFDENAQWGQTVSDLEALRVAEGATDRTYFGLVRLDYGFGTVGTAFLDPSTATAVGTDNPAEVKRVVAHELGHTWGQLHAPCGTPPESGVDRGFPYAGGVIGTYGFDATSRTVKPPSMPDVMGYCENPWISDYIYERVMTYRRTNPMRAQVSAMAQPSLLIWGHIRNGQAVLEPAFQITTRPRLPTSSGPYQVEAKATDGTRLFALSFDAPRTAHDGGRHFVFAVPLDQANAGRLASLRLSGPGIQVASLAQSAARLQGIAAAADIAVRGEGDAVTLRWDAGTHPAIMVRDPDSGALLAFARGGSARVWTGKRSVDLEVSNGVQSYRVRRAISR